jgi:hypothetical protein
MLHSHTASGFWLGFPRNFCKEFLPHREKITLVDEKTLEWECVYLANKAGLSGGWHGFSLDHELVDGDCLIFELTQSQRFKVYIFHCEEDCKGDEEADMNEGGTDGLDKDAAMEKKKTMNYNKKAPTSAPLELGMGKKVSTSIRNLDLEGGDEHKKEGNDGSPETSKKGVDLDSNDPSKSLKHRRVDEEDDDNEAVVAPRSVKKGVKSKK